MSVFFSICFIRPWKYNIQELERNEKDLQKTFNRWFDHESFFTF